MGDVAAARQLAVIGRRVLAGAGALSAAAAAGLAAGAIARCLAPAASGVHPGPPGAGASQWPRGTFHHLLTVSDGAVLHVAERGAGRPVLLLHGLGLSAGVWAEQLRRLPDLGMRVLAADLRGHGGSSIGAGGLALERVAVDTAELAGALELDDVVVVGHSMGGVVALGLLGADPALARGEGWLTALALVATSARPVDCWPLPGIGRALTFVRPALAPLHALARPLPGPTLPDRPIADRIVEVTFATAPPRGAVRLVRRLASGVPASTTLALALQLVGLDRTGVLAGVGLPTSVVAGSADVVTPLRHARALARGIPGARLVELDGCGHAVMLERPDELDAVVADLASRRAPSSPSRPAVVLPLRAGAHGG